MENIENNYKNLRVEFHILQSFPVTCLNRDDVGAPKTAIVGGVTRARVSSQCWKRPVRMVMQNFGVKLGVRTKHVSEKISKECLSIGANDSQANECAEIIASALTKDTLHFFTDMEAKALAEYAKTQGFKKESISLKDVVKVHKKAYNPSVDGLDIALFGRMVAQAADLNVEAAASFAHAISTHKVTNEVEFFTALDDMPDAPGSAHMGSMEFNSATYYRYISLDLGQLVQTLGDDGFVPQALEAFVKALYLAVPSARQTTQSGASPWEFAKILVRNGQRLQVPFEEPVKAKGEGFLKPSINELTSYLEKKGKLAGSLFGKLADFTYGEDEKFNIDALIDGIKKAVKV